MKAISEVSYGNIICPNCLKEHKPVSMYSNDEFVIQCDNCNTNIRIVEELVYKYTSSMILE